MSIRVHIERLILEGLPIASHEGPALQAAVEAELTRLLTAEPLANLASLRAAPVLSNAVLQLTKAPSAGELGGQIAGSLHESFKGAMRVKP